MTADALLSRQIARATGPDGALDQARLLALVADAYREKDLDRRRADRASRLMSQELDGALAEINRQNVRFKAALDNMIQGLCMFDAGGGLTVCNRRFLDLYRLPEEAAPPGAALGDILGQSGALADLGALDRYMLVHAHLMLDAVVGGTTEQAWPDGRVLSINRQPIPGGGFLDTVADVTEARRASARIAHLAGHDSLTDLANRLTFRENLVQAVNDSGPGRLQAVLCLDLDRFKPVNDTLGHPVGDLLLVAVARRLLSQTRSTDIVARLGGDEFAIIQRSFGAPEEAEVLARRLIQTLSQPYAIAGHHLHIGTTIGIEIVTSPGADPDQVLRNADLALYRAKDAGRGSFCRYSPEMSEIATQRHQVESDLRRAVSADEFEVHYQPQIDLIGGRLTGFEALVRWAHPLRGLVAPRDFIGVAEGAGLIGAIGRFVLETAARDAALWPDDLTVAVNLSARQFPGGQVAANVREVLALTGLAPHRLEVEVTETVMSENATEVIAQLSALKEMGVRVSLDDFGTGYSSLGYVRDFPFDRIKIDQSFVRGLRDRPDNLAIVRAVTGLCRSLGISATAEGVETEEELALLMQENCDSAQGFLFGAAVPVAQTHALLRPARPDWRRRA